MENTQPQTDNRGRIAVMLMLMLSVGSIMFVGGVSAAETTEQIEAVNATDLDDVKVLNVTVEVEGIDSESELVQSYDSGNNSAVIQTEFDGQPVNSSLSWEADDSTVTTDLTTSPDWPPEMDGDVVNVTVDQSVDTVDLDGNKIHGGSVLGGAVGGASDDSILIIAAVAVLAFLYARD